MTVFDQVIAFLYAAILAGVPLLFGTLGEIITQKVGNINLGVEGMMYMGAIMGFLGAQIFQNMFLAIIFAFLAGAFGALIYAFLTVTLKANQNVTGLTLTIFGTGFANFIGENLKGAGMVTIAPEVLKTVTPMQFGALTDIPVLGKLLFNHSIITYAGIVVAIIVGVYLNKTRYGLNMRAIGENPAAADAMGINITKYKYCNIIFGGGLCGIGGAYISLVTCVGNWQPNIIGGQGWICVALVIFASWKPYRAILGSFIFGALSVLRFYVPSSLIPIPSAFYLMLPFVVTCIVLIVSSIKMNRENQQPAACGVNYFREER